MFKEIKARCIMNELSIKELSELAHISPNAIYNWDTSFPSVDKVYKVAKVLGCTVEELCQDQRFR